MSPSPFPTRFPTLSPTAPPTPFPTPVPSIYTLEWEIEIDFSHSSVNYETAADTITVSFYSCDPNDDSARCFIDSVSIIGPTCSTNDEWRRFFTTEPTWIVIETNGDDGFFLDQIFLVKHGLVGEEEVQHWGDDDGTGWCLSTDPNDHLPDWVGWAGFVSGCYSQIYLEVASGQVSFTTQSPSSSLTIAPAMSPSAFPTRFPTLSPSNPPTTQSPSSSPTIAPTMSPSAFPTRFPTLFPTAPPTPFPTPVPSIYTLEWEIEIDCSHSFVNYETTADTITVSFYSCDPNDDSAGCFIDSVSIIGPTCSRNDEWRRFFTTEPTWIVIEMNGDDGFFLDQIFLVKHGLVGEEEAQHWGDDDGTGWCLSTDPNDHLPDWVGWAGFVSGCYSQIYLEVASGLVEFSRAG